MKILQIIPSLMIGGGEKFCVDLSNELAKEDETILCSLYDKVPSNDISKKIDKNVKLITLGKKRGLDMGMFFKLYKLVKRENPQIIHTHLSGLFYSIPTVVFTKNSFFHTMHTLAQKEAFGLMRFLQKIAFNYLHVKPISISETVLFSTKKIYSKKHNLMIENGVASVKKSENFDKVTQEIDGLKNDKNTKVFIHVASIRERKNQLLLIEVFNSLIQEGENIILVIIGGFLPQDKSYKDKVVKSAKEGIYLLGSKQNVDDYLLQSDAFCLTSSYEGLPISLLEAMSAGVVPICTPVGGMADILDKDFSFLSDDLTYKAYKKSVEEFLALSEKEVKEFSKKLKNEFNKKYDVSICTSKYKDEFKKVIHA